MDCWTGDFESDARKARPCPHIDHAARWRQVRNRLEHGQGIGEVLDSDLLRFDNARQVHLRIHGEQTLGEAPAELLLRGVQGHANRLRGTRQGSMETLYLFVGHHSVLYLKDGRM